MMNELRVLNLDLDLSPNAHQRGDTGARGRGEENDEFPFILIFLRGSASPRLCVDIMVKVENLMLSRTIQSENSKKSMIKIKIEIKTKITLLMLA